MHTDHGCQLKRARHTPRTNEPWHLEPRQSVPRLWLYSGVGCSRQDWARGVKRMLAARRPRPTVDRAAQGGLGHLAGRLGGQFSLASLFSGPILF